MCELSAQVSWNNSLTLSWIYYHFIAFVKEMTDVYYKHTRTDYKILSLYIFSLHILYDIITMSTTAVSYFVKLTNKDSEQLLISFQHTGISKKFLTLFCKSLNYSLCFIRLWHTCIYCNNAWIIQKCDFFFHERSWKRVKYNWYSHQDTNIKYLSKW